MAAYFILSDDDEQFRPSRLLSYSGAIKGGKLILTLKVEVSDSMDHVLSSLEAIQKHHSAKPKVRTEIVRIQPRRIGKAKLLALPPPQPSGG